jgi:flagellar basal body-associated protein FliL
MVKKLVPVIALLVVLGGVYKFVLAKPAKAAPEPNVHGTVYMLEKEFLINLAEGRFAKMQIGLVLAHDDTSTVAAGGHGAAPTPPEGYGAMGQEGIVRDLITGELTDQPADELESEHGREELKKKILKILKKKTDVHVEEILFSDLTIQ